MALKVIIEICDTYH